MNRWRIRKMRRAWDAAAKGMRMIDRMMADMDRSERRRIESALVKGKPMPPELAERIAALGGTL